MKKTTFSKFCLFLLSATLLFSFSACSGAAASSQVNATNFYAEPEILTEEASASFSDDIANDPVPSAQKTTLPQRQIIAEKLF